MLVIWSERRQCCGLAPLRQVLQTRSLTPALSSGSRLPGPDGVRRSRRHRQTLYVEHQQQEESSSKEK